MELKYKLLVRGAKDPVKEGHDDDDQLTAGINLFSTVKARINTNSYSIIPTGVAFEIPKGKMGLLRARSGFAARTGSTVNAGVIDANYRGEIKVVMNNPTDGIIDVMPGDGIAQMLILPVPKIELRQVNELSDTVRGEQGFNSTGK